MPRIAGFCFWLLLAAVVQALVPGHHCYGDSPAEPRGYAIPTPNKKYVFRMVTGGSYSTAHVFPRDKKWYRERTYIPPAYPSSGMYRNDGSKTPLWTVAWYAFEVIPFSDGEHVVRFGPWPSEYNQLAIAFHHRDKEIARYRIDELVKEPRLLPKTVSHFFWKAGVVYDDKQGLLYLGTLNGELYSFDSRTGKHTEHKCEEIGKELEDVERAILIAVLNGMTVRVKILNSTESMAVAGTCSMQEIRKLAKRRNLQILDGHRRHGLPTALFCLDKLSNANHIDFSAAAVLEDEMEKHRQSMINRGVDLKDPRWAHLFPTRLPVDIHEFTFDKHRLYRARDLRFKGIALKQSRAKVHEILGKPDGIIDGDEDYPGYRLYRDYYRSGRGGSKEVAFAVDYDIGENVFAVIVTDTLSHEFVGKLKFGMPASKVPDKAVASIKMPSIFNDYVWQQVVLTDQWPSLRKTFKSAKEPKKLSLRQGIQLYFIDDKLTALVLFR